MAKLQEEEKPRTRKYRDVQRKQKILTLTHEKQKENADRGNIVDKHE